MSRDMWYHTHQIEVIETNRLDDPAKTNPCTGTTSSRHEGLADRLRSFKGGPGDVTTTHSHTPINQTGELTPNEPALPGVEVWLWRKKMMSLLD